MPESMLAELRYRIPLRVISVDGRRVYLTTPPKYTEVMRACRVRDRAPVRNDALHPIGVVTNLEERPSMVVLEVTMNPGRTMPDVSWEARLTANRRGLRAGHRPARFTITAITPATTW